MTANGTRSPRQNRKGDPQPRALGRRRRLVLEPIEERLLLSADLEPVANLSAPSLASLGGDLEISTAIVGPASPGTASRTSVRLAGFLELNYESDALRYIAFNAEGFGEFVSRHMIESSACPRAAATDGCTSGEFVGGARPIRISVSPPEFVDLTPGPDESGHSLIGPLPAVGHGVLAENGAAGLPAPTETRSEARNNRIDGTSDRGQIFEVAALPTPAAADASDEGREQVVSVVSAATGLAPPIVNHAARVPDAARGAGRSAPQTLHAARPRRETVAVSRRPIEAVPPLALTASVPAHPAAPVELAAKGIGTPPDLAETIDVAELTTAAADDLVVTDVLAASVAQNPVLACHVRLTAAPGGDSDPSPVAPILHDWTKNAVSLVVVIAVSRQIAAKQQGEPSSQGTRTAGWKYWIPSELA